MKREDTKLSSNRFFTECKQTLFVTGYIIFLLTSSLLGWLIWFFIVYLCPVLRIPMLIYAAWIYYDRDVGEYGGRRFEMVRRLSIWKNFRDYFPAKLIKTTDLPADRNYIFCCFPHGILASGIFAAFGNFHGGCEKLFPGLKFFVLTLSQHFKTPFIRDYILSIGCLPASASCMNRMLNRKEKGKSLILLVGGAQETFYTKPGSYKLNLLNRKGFIKIALKTGTPLVPVITFGEPDIYRLVEFKEGSFCHRIQMTFKRITGIAPVIFYGRFSITPHRRPLYTVVGHPIQVEKVESPTADQIQKLHADFIEKLNELFEKEKYKYIDNAENIHLIIT